MRRQTFDESLIELPHITQTRLFRIIVFSFLTWKENAETQCNEIPLFQPSFIAICNLQDLFVVFKLNSFLLYPGFFVIFIINTTITSKSF